jgi:UDP-N-acetylglucosamine diphosphorylase/glucosamine-1-phosphate N-acetyltransferase
MKSIVLAAGKGKRLNSEQLNLPKVLRQAAGNPLIKYVLNNISFIHQEDTIVVVGYEKDMVMDYIGGNYKFVTQNEQLGTGHAVMMAEEVLKSYNGDVLVLYGDMPLLTMETFKNLACEHKKSSSNCTVMTAIADNPPPYGRIIRNCSGELTDIIEVKDCSEEQLAVNEINVGVYVFDSKTLFSYLKELKNNNSQKEYYLTDVPKILLNHDISVNTFTLKNIEEIFGVNTPEDLEYCENVLGKREEVKK